jgi:hypothetical protein
MVRLVADLVLWAMLTMPTVPPAVDPLMTPLSPQTLVGHVEMPCPDGSVITVRVHDTLTGRRI